MSRGSGPRKRHAAARQAHSVGRQRGSEQVASERREVAEGGMARLSSGGGRPRARHRLEAVWSTTEAADSGTGQRWDRDDLVECSPKSPFRGGCD